MWLGGSAVSGEAVDGGRRSGSYLAEDQLSVMCKLANYYNEFVKEQKNDVQETYIEELLQKDLPHYLWYTEISMKDDMVCLFADPTMYYGTKDVQKIFLNCPPIALVESKRLPLLTKSRGSM